MKTIKMLIIGFFFHWYIAAFTAVIFGIAVAALSLAMLAPPTNTKYVAPNIDISKCQIVDTISADDQTYKISCKR